MEQFHPVKDNNETCKTDPETPGLFTGSWSDNNGAYLIVYLVSGSFKADYSIAGRDHKKNTGDFTSKNLPAKPEGTRLIIEPGIPGLGPTLELTFMQKDNKDILIPSTGMGLYDDYSEDLGVPWIFPLKIFERLE